MPEVLRKRFSKSENVVFDIKQNCRDAVQNGTSSNKVLHKSIVQHAQICVENSKDVYDALALALLLDDSIDYRIQEYLKCICKSTQNFGDWLKEDYRKKRAFQRICFFHVVFHKHFSS